MLDQAGIIHALFIAHMALAALALAAAFLVAPLRMPTADIPRGILVVVAVAFLAVDGLVDPMPLLIEGSRPWTHHSRVLLLDILLLSIAAMAVLQARREVRKHRTVTP